MPYVPLQCDILIKDDPPSKRVCFLWGLIWHMPLKTIRCCGGTSSLEQRSVLRGMHPINPTTKHIRLLGGLSPINPTRQQAKLALESDSRGLFPPAAIMVGLVVCVACSPGPVLPEPLRITHCWNRLVNRKLNVIFKSVNYVGISSELRRSIVSIVRRGHFLVDCCRLLVPRVACTAYPTVLLVLAKREAIFVMGA